MPGGSGSSFGCQARVGLSYFASRSTDLFVEGNYFGNTGVDPGSGTASAASTVFGIKGGFPLWIWKVGLDGSMNRSRLWRW